MEIFKLVLKNLSKHILRYSLRDGAVVRIRRMRRAWHKACLLAIMVVRMHIDTAFALYPKHDYRRKGYKARVIFLNQKCSSGCKVLPLIKRVLRGWGCVYERERFFEGLPVITALMTSSKWTVRSTDTALLKHKTRSYWLHGTHLEQDIGIIWRGKPSSNCPPPTCFYAIAWLNGSGTSC